MIMKGKKYMQDVYQNCEQIQGKRFSFRFVEKEDLTALLKVYSDKNSLPFFNADNCHGDIFYYPTLKRMEEALNFWIDAYHHGWFVRYAIIDQLTNEVVGTIELCKRVSKDSYDQDGILRIDVRSDYENKEALTPLIKEISPAFKLFSGKGIITKAPYYAVERIEALKEVGFNLGKKPLVTDEGKVFEGYWVKEL